MPNQHKTYIVKLDDLLRMHLRIYFGPTKYTTVQSLLMMLAMLLQFMGLISLN